MFNATSADKPPGCGVMENISAQDKKQNTYSSLRKISNWRKMLSNEFVVNELFIEDNKWASVEHYLLGCHLKKKSMNDYEKLMTNGEHGHETISNIKAILKVKKYDYVGEDLQRALAAKFDPETNPQMCKVLEATKNASLTLWKRGMQYDLDADGNKRARCCNVTTELMRIRQGLLSSEDEGNVDMNKPEELSQSNSNIDPSGLKRGPHETQEDSATSKVNIQTPPDDSMHCVKILSKKEIDNYNDFISKYNPSCNKSSNILTVYERTNILGIRMEQLALGADTYLEHEEAVTIGNVKEIAKREFEEKKIPFIICRVLPDNSKEYWKLEHMFTNNF